jgi:hypothetical protein
VSRTIVEFTVDFKKCEVMNLKLRVYLRHRYGIGYVFRGYRVSVLYSKETTCLYQGMSTLCKMEKYSKKEPPIWEIPGEEEKLRY